MIAFIIHSTVNLSNESFYTNFTHRPLGALSDQYFNRYFDPGLGYLRKGQLRLFFFCCCLFLRIYIDIRSSMGSCMPCKKPALCRSAGFQPNTIIIGFKEVNN